MVLDPALRALGEFGLIDRIRARAAVRSAGTLCGIGDDAAVLAWGAGGLLATLDMLLEDVHFRRRWGRPRDLGRKTLAVNLSDIAAMGGDPLYALLGLALPGTGIPLAEIEAVLEGLEAEAAAFGVTLVGGDTCRSHAGLVLTITLLGRPPAAGPVLRSGARAGDTVYVTGQLGGSAAGLLALERGLRPDAPWPASLPHPGVPLPEETIRDAMACHLTPVPRVAAGRALAGRASAMIDVSDGVASDAGHLSRASGATLRLDVARLPVHPGAAALGPLLDRDPLALALQGGEDYELLFTAAEDPTALLAAAAPGLPVTAIGRVVAGPPGVRLVDAHGREMPPPPGFDHFAG